MHINVPSNHYVKSFFEEQKFLDSFMANMKNISGQTGVELMIDTQRQSIARMQPGKKDVYFNPIYAQATIQAIFDKRRKEEGLTEPFVLDVNHLSAFILHEINHMINHNNLVTSTRTITKEGTTMNMIEYQQHMYRTYGQEFQTFENILEDIDVNHHATRVQAPVYESSKQDIYRHISTPSLDFRGETLQEQFAWTILRESMINEQCLVAPLIRTLVNNLGTPGHPLQIIRDAHRKYDEQFIAISKLWKDYYLMLKEKQNQLEDKNQAGNNDKNKSESSESSKGESENQGKSKENQHNGHPKGTEGTSQEQNNGENDEGIDSESQTQGELGEGKEKGNSNSSSGAKGNEVEGSQDSKDKGQESEGKNSQRDNDASPGDTKDSSELHKGGDKDDNDQQIGESSSTGQNNKSSNINQFNTPPKPSLFPSLFDNLDEENTTQQLFDTLNNHRNSESITEGQNQGAEGQNITNQPSTKSPLLKAIQNAILEQIAKADRQRNISDADRKIDSDIEREFGVTQESDPTAFEKLKKKIQARDKLEAEIKKSNIYKTIVEDIFNKIINIRKKPQIYEKSPRNFSEGGVFDARSLVGGMMSMRAGNDDPRIMRQEHHKDKITKTAGAFNITIIPDGSGSMDSPTQKNIDQKLNTLLTVLACADLNDQLSDRDLGLTEDMHIQTAVTMFVGGNRVKEIKTRSGTFTLKEKIALSEGLDYKGGNDTNAYDAIFSYYDTICNPLPEESSEDHIQRQEDIESGKIKEVCIVMSDGGFNRGDDEKAQALTAIMRQAGIIVCGIGITKGGAPMVKIFGAKTDDEEQDKGGFGLICKQTTDLGNTLNELLLYHLSQQDIIGKHN